MTPEYRTTPEYGPTFGAELRAALGDVALAWNPTTGALTGVEQLSDEQNTVLAAVIAAHDPGVRLPRFAKRKELFRAADDLGWLLGLDAAAKATPKRKDQIAWACEDVFLESNPSLKRLCGACGYSVAALFDRVEANAAAN